MNFDRCIYTFIYFGQRSAFVVTEMQQLHLILRASACRRGRKRPRCFLLQLLHNVSYQWWYQSLREGSKDVVSVVGSSSQRVYFTFSWLFPRLLGYVSEHSRSSYSLSVRSFSYTNCKFSALSLRPTFPQFS